VKLLTTQKNELPPLDPSAISLRRDLEYRDADARLQSLRGDYAQCEREINSIEAARARQFRESETLTARAEAMLDGRPEPEAEPSREQLSEAYDQRVLLREAIRLQELRLQGIRQRVSAEICEELKPRHRQIVQNVAATLQALARALAKEQDFRDALNSADISFAAALRPMPLRPAIGRLADPYSHVSRWLAEAEEYGLL